MVSKSFRLILISEMSVVIISTLIGHPFAKTPHSKSIVSVMLLSIMSSSISRHSLKCLGKFYSTNGHKVYRFTKPCALWYFLFAYYMILLPEPFECLRSLSLSDSERASRTRRSFFMVTFRAIVSPPCGNNNYHKSEGKSRKNFN